MPDDPNDPPATRPSGTRKRSAIGRFTTTDIALPCALWGVLGALLICAAMMVVGHASSGSDITDGRVRHVLADGTPSYP